MCCENSGYSEKEINGECIVCGEPTVDGNAYDKCAYGEVICDECLHAPCHGAC